jgi:hypothetical protein
MVSYFMTKYQIAIIILWFLLPELRGTQGTPRGCRGIPLTVTRVVLEEREAAVVDKTRV